MSVQRGLDAAHKAFANDRSHRPAHKSKFKAGSNGWKSVNGATKDNQRIRLARLARGHLKTLGIFAAVFEFQRIDRRDVLADFITTFCVEQMILPRARANPHMVCAFGTDMQ